MICLLYESVSDRSLERVHCGWRTLAQLRPPLTKDIQFGLPCRQPRLLRCAWGVNPGCRGISTAILRPVNLRTCKLQRWLVHKAINQISSRRIASSPRHPVLRPRTRCLLGVMKKQLDKGCDSDSGYTPTTHLRHARIRECLCEMDKIHLITRCSKLGVRRSSRGCRGNPFQIPTLSSGGVRLL
jgi:hypothetical protein